MNTEHEFGSDINSKNFLKDKLDIESDKRPASMFYIWFASNLTVGDFAVGFIPVYLGLPIIYSVMAIVIGTVAGGIMLSYMSQLGVIYRVPQMYMGRAPFGTIGGSLLSILQWGNTAGWLTVNVILASLAIYEIMKIPYYLIIMSIVIAVALTALIGYRAIRILERSMSYVLGILFVFLIIFLIYSHFSISYPYAPVLDIPSAFGITFASAFSYIMSWGPYAADYSRHVQLMKPSRIIFYYTLLGSVIASVFAEIVGMLVSAASGNPSGSPAADLSMLMNKYALIGMLALFLGGIAANAINLYSNSLAFLSIGFRSERWVAIIVASIFSFAMGILGFFRFYGFYETFLFILDYWITPWIGIMIAHFFMVRKLNPERFNDLPRLVKPGIYAYLISIIVSIPFMAPAGIISMPVAALLHGVDISYFVSFFLAMILYLYFSKLSVRQGNIQTTVKNIR
ncbi:cytosine permease [Thermoplasma sp. Kam2015]|uniref:purine-cytosine permease family protein n=1 Tax=Thermoplasma sp. Kam2015 TaxID=2094122 RepID=UPI000D8FE09C|nr:cytosine permease [Thermoplasma sp. Kam2015]PYB68595.1 cytosine permease [Thermoplasma sp. Kam2015]